MVCGVRLGLLSFIAAERTWDERVLGEVIGVMGSGEGYGVAVEWTRDSGLELETVGKAGMVLARRLAVTGTMIGSSKSSQSFDAIAPQWADGLEVGWIRCIQELDTAYWGFLGVGTTLDIFQNIILIPYLEYGVLSPLDTAY
ncbi:hypothetical protein Tco_0064534 [Tanacetum coccineum]